MFSNAHRALRNMSFSFEYFPPKSIDATFELFTAAQKLDHFNPAFISVTYGAGGSSKQRSDDVIKAMKQVHTCPTVAHITAVGEDKAAVLGRAERLLASGVLDFVALRGDPEQGKNTFTPHPNGFASSIELISALRNLGARNIYVGAYPNRHPEAASIDAHIDYLKRKFDAGANAAITQFFFNTDDFLYLRDASTAAGYTQDIIPGLIPVNNWPRLQSFAKKCAIEIPQAIEKGFENAGRDGNFDLYATALLLQQCDRLAQEGVAHVHLYTLNASKLSENLFAAMGLRPQKGQNVAA